LNDGDRAAVLDDLDGDAVRRCKKLLTSAPGRVIQSGTPERHAVGSDTNLRHAKEAFVEEVADRAADICRERSFSAVFVTAPARLVGPLRQRLETEVDLAGALQKDLTKAPDAELGRWLDHLHSTAQD
jgi:protein required for attachment to host cells